MGRFNRIAQADSSEYTYSMKYLILLLLVPGLVFAQENANPPMEGFDMDASDPKAIEIADQVMMSMGGRAVWDQTRYLSWTLFGKDHVWDKWTGWFRWQGGDSTVVLMNIQTMEGQAFRDGHAVIPADELLTGAYRDWVNAGYWLLMPFKLKDSGVTLGYKGEERMGSGRLAHVLTLRFDGVGFTPDNGYDVFVDQEQNLVAQWSYYADADSDTPNFTGTWEGYNNYGGIMLADTRISVEDASNIRTITNLGVYDQLPESVFEDPSWMSLALLKEADIH